ADNPRETRDLPPPRSADGAAEPIRARGHAYAPREEAREVRWIVETERVADLADRLARVEELAFRLEQDAGVHELDRRLLCDREARLAQLRLRDVQRRRVLGDGLAFTEGAGDQLTKARDERSLPALARAEILLQRLRQSQHAHEHDRKPALERERPARARPPELLRECGEGTREIADRRPRARERDRRIEKRPDACLASRKILQQVVGDRDDETFRSGLELEAVHGPGRHDDQRGGATARQFVFRDRRNLALRDEQ